MALIHKGFHSFLADTKYFPVKTMAQAANMLDANHPKASMIPEVYHMYISKGGLEDLKLIRGESIGIFQFNDDPAAPSFAELYDDHRVYPGDGILPIEQILKI